MELSDTPAGSFLRYSPSTISDLATRLKVGLVVGAEEVDVVWKDSVLEESVVDSAVVDSAAKVVVLSDTASEELVLIDSADVVTEVNKVVEDVYLISDEVVKDVSVATDDVDTADLGQTLPSLFALPSIKLTRMRSAYTGIRQVSVQQAKCQGNSDTRTHCDEV